MKSVCSHLAAVPLVALICWSACYHWVPIQPNFANGQKTEIDEVRIGGEGGKELEGASLTWPMLTATKSHPVTIDLRETPADRAESKQWVPIEPNFANGQKRELGTALVGKQVLWYASIQWPMLTGFPTNPVIDLRQTPAEMRKMKAGAITAAIVIPLGIVSLIGIIGLVVAGARVAGLAPAY